MILGISYNRYGCNVQRLLQHLQQNDVAFSKNLTFKLTNNVSYILIMYGLNFNVFKTKLKKKITELISEIMSTD